MAIGKIQRGYVLPAPRLGSALDHLGFAVEVVSRITDARKLGATPPFEDLRRIAALVSAVPASIRAKVLLWVTPDLVLRNNDLVTTSYAFGRLKAALAGTTGLSSVSVGSGNPRRIWNVAGSAANARLTYTAPSDFLLGQAGWSLVASVTYTLVGAPARIPVGVSANDTIMCSLGSAGGKFTGYARRTRLTNGDAPAGPQTVVTSAASLETGRPYIQGLSYAADVDTLDLYVDGAKTDTAVGINPGSGIDTTSATVTSVPEVVTVGYAAGATNPGTLQSDTILCVPALTPAEQATLAAVLRSVAPFA